MGSCERTRKERPKARLTSIKIATANGASDVSQLIAAIDRVVQHKNDDPANPIRVINLSYGTDGHGWWWDDPLHYAVEKAWAAGLVVVVATGNDGNDNSVLLSNPATNPNILATSWTDPDWNGRYWNGRY